VSVCFASIQETSFAQQISTARDAKTQHPMALLRDQYPIEIEEFTPISGSRKENQYLMFLCAGHRCIALAAHTTRRRVATLKLPTCSWRPEEISWHFHAMIKATLLCTLPHRMPKTPSPSSWRCTIPDLFMSRIQETGVYDLLVLEIGSYNSFRIALMIQLIN
jgi:hypothetical protein